MGHNTKTMASLIPWTIIFSAGDSDLLMVRKFAVKAGTLVRQMRVPGVCHPFDGDPARHSPSSPSPRSLPTGSEPPESSGPVGTASTRSSGEGDGPAPSIPLLLDDRLTASGQNLAMLAGQLAALQAEVERLKGAQGRLPLSSGSDTTFGRQPPSRHDAVRSGASPPALRDTTTDRHSHVGLKGCGIPSRSCLR